MYPPCNSPHLVIPFIPLFPRQDHDVLIARGVEEGRRVQVVPGPVRRHVDQVVLAQAPHVAARYHGGVLGKNSDFLLSAMIRWIYFLNKYFGGITS